MRVLIIGSSVIDEIHQNEKIEIKAGGIFYTAAGLLSANLQFDIDLLTNYQKELGFYFDPIYKQVNLILNEENRFMPSVKLIVHKEKEREEIYRGFTKSLFFPSDINLNSYSAILINMISGFDISIEQLQKIRKDFNGHIYLDVHSLARGFDENNNRIFRPIENPQKFVNSVDVLQCNENELFTLSAKKKKYEIIKELFESNLKILIVTKGKEGAELYTKEEKIEHKIEVHKKVLNRVGCGDIFGAVFFSSYISAYDYKIALHKSVNTASSFTQFKNVYEFLDKGNDLYD